MSREVAQVAEAHVAADSGCAPWGFSTKNCLAFSFRTAARKGLKLTPINCLII